MTEESKKKLKRLADRFMKEVRLTREMLAAGAPDPEAPFRLADKIAGKIKAAIPKR